MTDLTRYANCFLVESLALEALTELMLNLSKSSTTEAKKTGGLKLPVQHVGHQQKRRKMSDNRGAFVAAGGFSVPPAK